MNAGMPTRVIAACLGLAAFCVALIAGLAADNPSEQILIRAIVSMFVGNAVGFVIGLVAERAVEEHLSSLRPAEVLHTQPTEPERSESGPGVINV